MTVDGSGNHNGGGAQGQRDRATGRFLKGNTLGYPKGVSGNPAGGRSRHDRLAELIEAIGNEQNGKRAETILYGMLKRMYKSQNALDRQNILSHGFGMPRQELEITRVMKMPDEELIAYVTELLSQLGARLDPALLASQPTQVSGVESALDITPAITQPATQVDEQ